ncbi:MAG: divalent-cation tolerance protein CutA [Chitinivibrionia bacterium]|nr:divalent-cation tolerance protein CutA [Chitinivibrionia bacterium]
MDDFIFAYITAKDKEQALSIGKKLIEERLAGCVNILDNMLSIYKWEGKVCAENEAVLIAKTTSEKFSSLAARVKELHTYDCPCIAALPVINGNSQYLDWLSATIYGSEK